MATVDKLEACRYGAMFDKLDSLSLRGDAMSIVIQLTFPAGRFHATPWGRHVNEGVPEWPPSPWRLLRALVAVWRRTCPDTPAEQVRRVLEAMTPPPRFRLPPHRVAHTRHYVPWEKKGPADRTLVFDTFVVLGRKDPLLVGWPEAELSAEDRATLARLLGNLTSLGRAEGWVHAELLEGPADLDHGPAAADDPNPVPVLCPDPANAFSDEHYPRLDPKKVKKGLKADERLFDCPRWHLCLDTQTIHAERWPRAPGARWVNYARPAVASTSGAPAAGQSLARQQAGGQGERGRRSITVARFILDGPVLPLVTETLPVAEAVRWELLRQCKRLLRSAEGAAASWGEVCRACPAITGRDEEGRPRQGHQHAFFLPADEYGDGRLTRLTVVAPGGFSDVEVRALQRLRTIPWGDRGEGEPLHAALIGLGSERDFRAPALGPSCVWVSATPFLATRMPKRRGRKKDSPELLGRDNERAFAMQVLKEELARRGLPAPVSVTRLPDDCIGGRRPLQFRRFRDKRGDDGGRRAAGAFRIEFAVPVAGPISLGHSCHFGLGLFVPRDE